MALARKKAAPAETPPAAPIDAPPAAASGDSRQYVTFHIEDGVFAVPLADVQEIIRIPDIVQVPLSHASLVGLANLRGTVMSVASLRRIFRYPDLDHDDSSRIVVINQGVPVGLVVDRMAAVVTAEPDQIEAVSSIEATINTNLLCGMIKAADGLAMIMILDLARLVETEFGGDGCGTQRAESGQAEIETKGQAEPAADELQLVSFEVDGQEYALAIESVQEIVHVPDRINRVPKTESRVLGVVTLRDRLLPLVSLRDMFGLPATPLEARNKIVVVPLPDQTSVGIVMDTVKEVLRVARSLVDPAPSLIRSGEGQDDIVGICRLEGGKRLVTVLSAEALFKNDVIRHAMTTVAGEGQEQAMNSDLPPLTDALVEEEQFVVFRLANEEYGAPIDSVREIVRVPEQLTRVPKSASFIKGVVNLRGAVLPVVDQRARFDLEDVKPNDRQRIIVFAIGGARTGFIVDSVSEVLRIPRGAIGPTPALSDQQARLITRVANLEQQKRMILLIDADHLLQPEEVSVARAVGVTEPEAAIGEPVLA